MFMKHKSGQQAENIASDFLRAQAYKIVARNWHCRFGEIDIIAKKKDLLLFVEVKYRKNKDFGGINYSINATKLKKIEQTCAIYLQQYPHKGLIRVDAILIEGSNQPIQIENILESYR